MKLKAITFVAVLCLSAAPGGAQQPDAKETGVMLGKGFGQLSAWIMKAADTVPADKYSYKPAPTVRSFGELLGHIADGSDYFCGRAGGKKVEWSDTHAQGKTDKATIVPKLKASLEACSAAHGTGNLGMLIQNYGHSNLHYGNMVTYLRMLGLVPPSTE